jgi:hypothetical protein
VKIQILGAKKKKKEGFLTSFWFDDHFKCLDG